MRCIGDGVGETRGALGAWVGHVDEHVLGLDHGHQVLGTADVVHATVLGVLRNQRGPGRALIHVVDGVREEEIPVAAEKIGVLQLGHHHEGVVRVAQRSLEQPVELLQLGGVTRPVDRSRDGDTGRTQHLEVREPGIHASGRDKLPAKIGVVMAAHHLVTGQWPVYISVREGERPVERLGRVAECRVEVACHVLLGSGRRAV